MPFNNVEKNAIGYGTRNTKSHSLDLLINLQKLQSSHFKRNQEMKTLCDASRQGLGTVLQESKFNGNQFALRQGFRADDTKYLTHIRVP